MAANPPNPKLAAQPNLFLLNPKNRAFVEGKSRYIEMYPDKKQTLRWFILWLGLFLLISLVIWLSSQEVAAETVFIFLFGGPLLSVILRRMLRHRRLVREGQLLMGQVSFWSLKQTSDGEGETVYCIGLDYIYSTPDGFLIEAQKRYETPRCPEFAPVNRAPVAVLYVNDKLYEVL